MFKRSSFNRITMNYFTFRNHQPHNFNISQITRKEFGIAGDFAVLLSAGMTMRQALLYNFLSACTCYLGLALGIVLGEFEASQYIFAIAGGMFLYISLVDMVPEMNEVAEEASHQSVGEALKILFLQNVGVILGVFALFILAKFQDQIRIG